MQVQISPYKNAFANQNIGYKSPLPLPLSQKDTGLSNLNQW